MKPSSDKTRWQVKPKPDNFVAPVNSDDPQLEIPPADQAGRPDQMRDLQEPGPGARAGTGWELVHFVNHKHSRKRGTWIFSARRRYRE